MSHDATASDNRNSQRVIESWQYSSPDFNGRLGPNATTLRYVPRNPPELDKGEKQVLGFWHLHVVQVPGPKTNPGSGGVPHGSVDGKEGTGWRNADMVAGVALLLLGVVTTLLSLQLPIGTLHAPGSGLFPVALGLFLVGLSVCHLIHLHLAGPNTPTHAEDHRDDGSTWRVLSFMGVMILGTASLTALGFPMVAFLLMAGLLYVLGLRRWQHVILIALCSAVASYLLFVRWLQIPLPKGWIGL
jgi:hypothetical protein